jgi:hypothetical protein
MSQKKVVSRNIAVGTGALCVVLMIGLVGVTVEYASMLNDKNSQISDLNSQISALQAQMEELNRTLFVERAAEFLLDKFNESLGLCREAPNVAPNTYWLVSDNLWAWKALQMVNESGLPDANRAGAVAKKIKFSLIELAAKYGLPTDSNGLPISYAHEAVIGDVALPPYKTATILTLHYDGFVLKTIILNGTIMDDWANYSDLLMYAALSNHWLGNDAEALGNCSNATKMWNATSIAIQDQAFNKTIKTYDTFKLALLLYTSRVLGQSLSFESELVNRIYSQQRVSDGGIVTNYYANGTSVGDANTETTSMVIIAVLTYSAKIGAYYYAWWGIGINNHWVKDNIKGTPSLGQYNSSDPSIADKQILLAKQHGIDFFAVSWMGKGDWLNWDFNIIDNNLRNGLLRAKHMADFSFCLFYETVLVLGTSLQLGKNFTQIFAEDMNYSLQYFSNPSYLRVNGDPVLFIYNVPYLYNHMATQDVHRLFDYVRQQLATKGVKLYIVGDMGGGPSPAGLSPDWLYSMNAMTSYFFDPGKKNTTGWNEVLEDARTYYPQWLSTMNSKGIAFVPNVYPGFNNTHETDVSPPWTVLPRDASSFGDMLGTALNCRSSSLGIVMITSWNEWMEGTMIEPSMKENEDFLNVVYDAVTGPELRAR